MVASFNFYHTTGEVLFKTRAASLSHFQTSFVQSIPGRVDTNNIGKLWDIGKLTKRCRRMMFWSIEHEVLHWILVEGKDPGRLALDSGSCQKLLDAIQEVRLLQIEMIFAANSPTGLVDPGFLW